MLDRHGSRQKEINRVEKKVETKVFYIKSLQADVEMLESMETDPEIKGALATLAEKIRFSDPMSNEALEDIEAEIVAKVKKLKDADDKLAIITALGLLITKRNKKAKLLK